MESNRETIIYVDDVKFGLITVKNMLKSRFRVFPAQSVPILFDILEHVKPDLILLDVKMPDVGGYDAIKQLKGDTRYAGIPVVFVTSNSDRESVQKSMSLGAAAHVNRPFSSQSLIETIESVLRFMEEGRC